MRRPQGCHRRFAGALTGSSGKPRNRLTNRVVSTDTICRFHCHSHVVAQLHNWSTWNPPPADSSALHNEDYGRIGPRRLIGSTATLGPWSMVAPISQMSFPTWPRTQRAVRTVCESARPGFTFGCVPPAATSAAAISPNTITPVTTTWPTPNTSSSAASSQAKPGGTAGSMTSRSNSRALIPFARTEPNSGPTLPGWLSVPDYVTVTNHSTRSAIPAPADGRPDWESVMRRMVSVRLCAARLQTAPLPHSSTSRRLGRNRGPVGLHRPRGLS